MGGVYGEEWMDVSGEGGNWEKRFEVIGEGFLGKCVYWKERMNVEKRGEYVRWGSCGVHRS